MEILYALEAIRQPWLDALFLVITKLGEETVFLAAALMLFWCVDKWEGYYVLTVGFLGTMINQALKIVCRIPRPWVADPTFSPVEEAIEAASGYSFPSGHTQAVTGTFGAAANWHRKRWLTVTAVVLILLTAFSRSYLGVHYPTDVLFSLGLGTLLVLIGRPLTGWIRSRSAGLSILLGSMTLLSLIYVLFAELFPFPADTDPGNLYSTVKNAWTLFGCSAGMLLSGLLEEKYIRFTPRAVWWVQLIKMVLGVGLILAAKALLKLPLAALAPDNLALLYGLRYFLVVILAALVWPATFRFWNRLADKKKGEK